MKILNLLVLALCFQIQDNNYEEEKTKIISLIESNQIKLALKEIDSIKFGEKDRELVYLKSLCFFIQNDYDASIIYA